MVGPGRVVSAALARARTHVYVRRSRAGQNRNFQLIAKKGFTSPMDVSIMRSSLDGGIAQLGERLHGMQEVSGSIPLTSTNKSNTGSPSSRGLGHRPFTAITGVRIPVGTPIQGDPARSRWSAGPA